MSEVRKGLFSRHGFLGVGSAALAALDVVGVAVDAAGQDRPEPQPKVIACISDSGSEGMRRGCGACGFPVATDTDPRAWCKRSNIRSRLRTSDLRRRWSSEVTVRELGSLETWQA